MKQALICIKNSSAIGANLVSITTFEVEKCSSDVVVNKGFPSINLLSTLSFIDTLVTSCSDVEI